MIQKMYVNGWNKDIKDLTVGKYICTDFSEWHDGQNSLF